MIIAAVAIATLALVVESDHNYLRDAATRGLYGARCQCGDGNDAVGMAQTRKLNLKVASF